MYAEHNNNDQTGPNNTTTPFDDTNPTNSTGTENSTTPSNDTNPTNSESPKGAMYNMMDIHAALWVSAGRLKGSKQANTNYRLLFQPMYLGLVSVV